MSNRRTQARLERLVAKRSEPDETIVEWARVWYSRAVRLQPFAARYRDLAVLTDRRLMLYEVGFWTRLPRRRVLADRLDELTVEDCSRSGDGRRVRFSKAGHRAMLLELDRGAALGAELLARAGRRIDDSPESVDAPEPEEQP